MVNRVMHAPINLYFDVTPIGRILNKFSKDLTTIDTQLVWMIGSLMATFYINVSIMIVAVMSVPWILLIAPIILFIAIKLYRYSIASYRETARIESITKSPLISFLQESYSGNSTIRAYKKDYDFIKYNNGLLNKNIVANMWAGAT